MTVSQHSGRARVQRLRHWLLGGAATAVMAGGCTTASDAPSPPSFSRPAQVAFACLRVNEEGTSGADQDASDAGQKDAGQKDADQKDATQVEPLPMSECGPGDTSTGRLHALVTQSETGEVALVDLVEQKVLDSREDVPGYTFIDVGALPVAVIVPEQASEYTYIANEDGQLGVFRTAELRPRTDRALRARAQEEVVMLPPPARPTAMAIAPDEKALFVVAENSGQLFRVPICRTDDCGVPQGHLLEPESIALPTVTDFSVIQGPEGEPYTNVIACADTEQPGFVLADAPSWPDGAEAADGAEADVSGDADAGVSDDAGTAGGRAAQPSDIVVDVACDGATGCAPRVLISDAAQPVIHRFEIGEEGLTALTPFATGAPTRALAATPDVPVNVMGDALTHYLYAIDDTDGSIMVLQDGALLPVNADPLSRVDRLPLGIVSPGTRAELLEVVDTSLINSASSCEFKPNQKWSDPTRMRGVYLVAGTSDGELRFYDVHDFDLLSEAGDQATCRRCPVVVQRHQPRVASDLGGVERKYVLGSVLTSAPVYFVGDRSLTVRNDGRTRDPRTPELACTPCPDGMARAFPNPANDTSAEAATGASAASSDASAVDTVNGQGEVCPDGEGRICAPTDPFVPSGDAWSLRYEGALPNAAGLAAFDSDTTVSVLQGATNLCALGVMAGDLFEITTEPAASARSIPACRALGDALRDGESAALFEIVEATATGLKLDTEVSGGRVADANVAARLPMTLDVVRSCFTDGPIGFRVRLRESFLVLGEAAGFLHRVVSDELGRCVEDPSQSALLTGRAPVALNAEDGLFNNGRMAITLVQRDEEQGLPLTLGVGLTFSVTNLGGPLVAQPTQLATGVAQNALLNDLNYSPVDGRLYTVDPYTQQLVGLSMAAEAPVQYE